MIKIKRVAQAPRIKILWKTKIRIKEQTQTIPRIQTYTIKDKEKTFIYFLNKSSFDRPSNIMWIRSRLIFQNALTLGP
jgi:hypothetical protein